MLSLLHQFPFEYVTLTHKQVGDYNFMNSVFVNPGIAASLVTVVIVSGNLLLCLFHLFLII